jgi:hypothetical protein
LPLAEVLLFRAHVIGGKELAGKVPYPFKPAGLTTGTAWLLGCVHGVFLYPVRRNQLSNVPPGVPSPVGTAPLRWFPSTACPFASIRKSHLTITRQSAGEFWPIRPLIAVTHSELMVKVAVA